MSQSQHLVTVRREVSLEDAEPGADSYEVIFGRLLDFEFVVAVSLDTRTPSSHSYPAFSITLRDTPANRQAIADFFNDDLEELDFELPPADLCDIIKT